MITNKTQGRGEAVADGVLALGGMIGAAVGALGGTVLGVALGTEYPTTYGTLGTMIGSGVTAGIAWLIHRLFSGTGSRRAREEVPSRADTPVVSAR
jgi:hypothetical protein